MNNAVWGTARGVPDSVSVVSDEESWWQGASSACRREAGLTKARLRNQALFTTGGDEGRAGGGRSEVTQSPSVREHPSLGIDNKAQRLTIEAVKSNAKKTQNSDVTMSQQDARNANCAHSCRHPLQDRAQHVYVAGKYFGERGTQSDEEEFDPDYQPHDSTNGNRVRPGHTVEQMNRVTSRSKSVRGMMAKGLLGESTSSSSVASAKNVDIPHKRQLLVFRDEVT
jgi:hypothetical protein